MNIRKRCNCCGKYFSLNTKYQHRRIRLGQTVFYCSRRCSALSLSKLGYVVESNKKRKKLTTSKSRTSQDKQWAKEVLKRDSYQCQHCGIREKLQAHHVLPYAKYPDKRLDLDNGITLCATCHSKQHPELPSYLFYQRYNDVNRSSSVKAKSETRRFKNKSRSKKKAL